MKADPPTADELALILDQCDHCEQLRLCQNEAFITAAGVSIEECARVASQFTGREILPGGVS